MKLVFVSDTHGMHGKIAAVPPGDVLVHCGDGTRQGKTHEAASLCGWLRAQPHKHKVMIAGNHDWCYERRALPDLDGIHYLENSAVVLDGVKVWGSPWTPMFYDWAFMADRGAPMRAIWAQIPDDVDVLVTHGPPLGIGDLAPRGVHAGCVELLKRVIDVRPKIHAFGHIHGGYGLYRTDDMPDTAFVNAAICDERYQPVNKPIVVSVS